MYLQQKTDVILKLNAFKGLSIVTIILSFFLVILLFSVAARRINIHLNVDALAFHVDFYV